MKLKFNILVAMLVTLVGVAGFAMSIRLTSFSYAPTHAPVAEPFDAAIAEHAAATPIVEATEADADADAAIVEADAAAEAPEDTIVPFHVRHMVPDEGFEMLQSGDLHDPENLKTGIFYDETTGTYRYGTQFVGGQSGSSSTSTASSSGSFLYVPFFMTYQDYSDWAVQQSMQDYFRKKNAEEFAALGKERFDFTDMHFDLGPAEKIFGPGGVRVKTNGNAELKIGGNYKVTDNPSLSERNRRVFGFDLDEKINISLNGKVGDKINMDFNYNTEAVASFDTQNLRLRYEGKEDEIIKLVEAGNVSMPTQSSLIRGAHSLFGLHTDFQLGKLTIQTMVAQKKSASSTVSSRNGVQTTEFEFSASDYDENRHFYLGHFFRDNYDQWMASLPNVMSGITINRIEVWITNKNGTTTNTRNLVALTDLGESRNFNHDHWGRGQDNVPSNNANNEYQYLTQDLEGVRDISQTTGLLDGAGLVGGEDYEKLESARLLTTSEYRLNSALGYISLKQALATDQVLAVAFEYTYRGQTYQVGEFSTDRKDNTQALIVKTLKNTACTPSMGNWDLMMRNVYYLGGSGQNVTNVQRDKFKLDIKLLSDTTGVYLSYIPEPYLKDKRLLTLMNLDRLDNNNKPNPNGYFDFVEGYTIESSTGRIYFPVAEPFGSHLRTVIGSDDVADAYCYPELYDSTKTIAKQIAEHNKFIIRGEYKASKSSEISLGRTNIPRGSVVVTAGGVTLVEGTDFSVDYNSGIVRILNQNIIDAGTSISCSVESNENYGMQRKTMVGLGLKYDFSRDFSAGFTVMHIGEKPLTTKVAMGEEPLNNLLWGGHLSWKKQSQWLTDMINYIPFINAKAPSSINFSAEFAQLVAGDSKGAQGNASYIDDFENTKSEISIAQPSEWTISSTPSMFPESKFTNDVRYGYNRALLSWYHIDPLFTRRSSSLTPGYIKGDLAQLSNPDVREVPITELFPNKSINYQDASTLSVLNLAFYPNERGPYNLDPNLDENGHLNLPQKRWGGMMRKLETSDFQTANIEYIEFWMMDPFLKYDGTITANDYSNGETPAMHTGDLYFNLGEISEDILKDGKKFYESGLPTDGDPSQYTETVWGRVPSQTSVTYAFNTSNGARERQDVGYNGLSSEDERTFGAYAEFLEQVRNVVRPEVYDSLLMAPSADRYHYFRGTDYDEAKVSVTGRYKYINNPNGNSVTSETSTENYSTAYKTTPDAEDINVDYTLNEYEKYYQYHVRISPEAMVVGQNYIVDTRIASAKTRDGNTHQCRWYLFRIPVDQYESKEGSINDFSSIRFMRMFMTGFETPTVLRFATLNLVRGEWRSYEQALYNGRTPDASGTLEVSAVNFEENNEKTPVNYVLPPGISRVIDPGNAVVLQNNEQALALTVKDLASGDARAVYKNTTLDLRNYKHLQLFVHANALPGDVTNLEDGQISLFLRLGSDYKNNFYEYEIPLTVTPEGSYSGTAGQREVWPVDNMLDIDLSLLTNLKRSRNKQKALGLIGFTNLYTEYDNDNPARRISIQGNPSLGEVKTIMIGVRNNSRSVKSVEVWANELRLQEFANNGGWAARSTLNMQLSDLATVNLAGHVETNGFGGLEETVSQRRDDDLYEYSVTTSLEAGKFLPEKVKFNAPIYYSYSKERTVPRYNPLDTDMSLAETLDGFTTQHERDSLSAIVEKTIISKNFSVSNVRFNRTTKSHPMPYDLSNFSAGYAHSLRYTSGETTAWERNENWKLNFTYNYSPTFKPFEPFKKLIKSKSNWLKLPKEFALNYVPQSLSFNTDISRTYFELQERDMDALLDAASNLDGPVVTGSALPLSFSSDFLWNRSFNLRWDPTKAIHFTFSSGTNAEVEQPYVAVNKDLYPDAYTAWKDSVTSSLRHFGDPLVYQQTVDASWNLPLNKIPLLDWITLDAKYTATYNWNRGTALSDGTSMGNVIANSRNMSANAKINFETLYNHWNFLKEVNKKFSSSGGKKPRGNTAAARQPKAFEKEITLQADTTVTVPHNQKSKSVRVTALRADGTRYPIKFKVLDGNRIEILNMDSVTVKVKVVPKESNKDKKWFHAIEGGARVLMMVRNISVSYKNTDNTSIPGFLPSVGDIFGQYRTPMSQATAAQLSGDDSFAPGLPFAFGFDTGEDYVRKAYDRGWLLCSDSIVSPATHSHTEAIDIKGVIEPVRDFKINLTMSRTENSSHTIQYMFEGMPITQTGSFNMTTVSISSAFKSSGRADNNYRNATFERFLNSLDGIRDRVEKQYEGARYPGTTQTFDPENGTVDKYSTDVMIPAFLEAYTDGNKGGLSIFPAITRMLPNWGVSYAGLAKLPRMKKIFKSFNLNHNYKSSYAVGNYSTFMSYMRFMEDLGFVLDVTSGMPIPSSMYDISTVSVNESFAPLAGIDMTFQNNLTAKVEYKQTRVVNLSMTSQQITETLSKDFTLGVGYKINDFNLFGPRNVAPKAKKAKGSRGTGDDEESGTSRPKTNTSSSRGGADTHALNLRLDVTYRDQAAIQRNIMTELSQATSGNRAFQLKLYADYTVSRYLTLSLFYERQMNRPLLTSSSYPTTTQDFGINLKFQLAR
ncbi:MAG: cell surface protein SprA [Bacteroidales bacterium]|nr:cell surface protein SprA [Bacteroidales bacterium]